MLKLATILAALGALCSSAWAQAEPDQNTSLFTRNSAAIDRTMNTGNDRTPPLGQAPGEQTGLGGSVNFGGGAAPGTQNAGAINGR